MEELVLRPSRKKWMTRLVLAGIGFIIGFYLGFILPKYAPNIPNWILMTVGLILMAYCTIMMLMCRSALSSKNKGLVFSRKGILDNSSIIAYGYIPWKEVVEIIMEDTTKTPRFLVMVKKPQTYIDSSGNNAIKNLRLKNLEQFGSPVLFESDQFQFDLNDFELFIESRKIKYSKKVF